MSQTSFWNKLIKKNAVLNPVDRISEVLFGLIMVLTFTGAISVSNGDRQEIRELLWAALGCNLAWGLVDGIMYLMNVLVERGHAIKVLKKLKQNKDPDSMTNILKEELQPLVSELLTQEEMKNLALRIKTLPTPTSKNLITGKDLLAFLQIFALVFFCTLPVAIPFALFSEVGLALRFSNGVALVLLFIGGLVLARYAGFRPFVTGLVYTLIGVGLVFITMALGG